MEEALQVRVKVIPKSSRTELAAVLDDGTLRVRVAAAPEKGKANAALCEFLAGHFGVPKSKVRVVKGHSAAQKVVEIG